MINLILLIFSIIKIETYQLDNETYFLISSDTSNLNFSSYRLVSPERIVLEISNEKIENNKIIPFGEVKDVRIEQKSDKVRIIFSVSPETSYTVLNRNQTLLAGFKKELYIDDANFEEVASLIKNKGVLVLKDAKEELKITAVVSEPKSAEPVNSTAEKTEVSEPVMSKSEEKVIAKANLSKPETNPEPVLERPETKEELKIAAVVSEPKSAEPVNSTAEKTEVSEPVMSKSEEKVMVKAVKVDESGTVKNLKVVKVEERRKIAENSPLLKVVKVEKNGRLNNIYFRKFEDFSRLTLEVAGSVDYRFREIEGGFVIDVFNLKKIPKFLLNIIDTRAFNAEIKYIYPMKKDNIFKIYIKTDKGTAVRKSESGKFINFDFFIPVF